MAIPDKHIFKFIFFISTFSLFLFSSCLSSDWKMAQLKDSIDSYESFIKKYPENEKTKEAKERIELLQWDNIKEINTKKSYFQFLSEYPDSEMASVAKRNIIDLEWLEVTREDHQNAYQTFIKSYPGSNHVKSAKKRIIELDWEETSKKNKLATYKLFLSKYKDSPYTKKAELEIEKSEAVEKEFDLYTKAKKLNTLHSYIDYLAIYPKGKYSDKVRYRLLGKLPEQLVQTVKELFSEDVKKREESIAALYGQEPAHVSSILIILLGLIDDENPNLINKLNSEEEVNHLYELMDLFKSMNEYIVPELITLLNNQNIPLETKKKIINILVDIYDARAVEPFSRILNSYNTDCILRLHLIKAMFNRE